MTTLLLTHPECHDHRVPAGHPESPARLMAIEKILAADAFSGLLREEAPPADESHLLLAHDAGLVEAMRDHVPEEGLFAIDPDTMLSPGSWNAALRAAGAAVRAAQAVANREADNAFCAIRPPGHHAERHKAMGFCLFNNAAIAARYLTEEVGAERVAIVDFDVHHGNGTQDIVWDEADILYCSTHQHPAYPGTGQAAETGAHGNVVNCPLPPQSGSQRFREAVNTRILPALNDFTPEFIIISAGFDAHARDPLASLNLTEEDYAWITLKLMEVAATHAGGRIVSLLEGGYDLKALAASVAVHVKVLMEGGAA